MFTPHSQPFYSWRSLPLTSCPKKSFSKQPLLKQFLYFGWSEEVRKVINHILGWHLSKGISKTYLIIDLPVNNVPSYAHKKEREVNYKIQVHSNLPTHLTPQTPHTRILIWYQYSLFYSFMLHCHSFLYIVFSDFFFDPIGDCFLSFQHISYASLFLFLW